MIGIPFRARSAGTIDKSLRKTGLGITAAVGISLLINSDCWATTTIFCATPTTRLAWSVNLPIYYADRWNFTINSYVKSAAGQAGPNSRSVHDMGGRDMGVHDVDVCSIGAQCGSTLLECAHVGIPVLVLLLLLLCSLYVRIYVSN